MTLSLSEVKPWPLPAGVEPKDKDWPESVSILKPVKSDQPSIEEILPSINSFWHEYNGLKVKHPFVVSAIASSQFMKLS